MQTVAVKTAISFIFPIFKYLFDDLHLFTQKEREII